MFAQLRNALRAKSAPEGKSLQGTVLAHLLCTYQAGHLAKELRQDELSAMITHHIFDLLDWARQNLEGFTDAQSITDSSLTSLLRTALPYPRNVGELEAIVEHSYSLPHTMDTLLAGVSVAKPVDMPRA